MLQCLRAAQSWELSGLAKSHRKPIVQRVVCDAVEGLVAKMQGVATGTETARAMRVALRELSGVERLPIAASAILSR